MKKIYDKYSAVRKYLPIVHEIDLRIQLISEAFGGELKLKGPFVYEYVYFQFRRICELIALGCLIIHGYIEEFTTSKFQNEWSADRIMHTLNKVYPHAFPQQVTRNGENGFDLIFNDDHEALSLSDFKSLYTECGSVLHRGTVSTLNGEAPISDEQFGRAKNHLNKIVKLINVHALARADMEGIFLVNTRVENGFPHVTIMNKTNSGYTLEFMGMEMVETSPDTTGLPTSRYLINRNTT